MVLRALIYTVLFTTISSLHAQQMMNDKMYMQYRDRFREDFILLDTSAGGGIPLFQRKPFLNCDDPWMFGQVCTRGFVEGKKGALEWGDGTAYMGHYLSVLATEYELFRRSGKPTRQTVLELSIVMEALKRLDMKAEEKFQMKGVSDGFFLRDDVVLETGLKIDSSFGCVISGAVCKGGGREGNVVSQDQMINLLFGTGFVVKYLPDTVLNPYSGLSIRDELVDFMHTSFRRVVRSGWSIKDPTGSNVSIGAGVVGYSHGLVKAAKKILGKSYGNLISFFVGRPLWTILEETPYQPSNNLHNEVNLSLQLCVMSMAGARHPEVFEDLCLKGNLEIYLLAEPLLNNSEPVVSDTVFIKLLSTVPRNGTCNECPGCENKLGWMATNRWFHPDNKDGRDYQRGCQFNGLDVMMLYNFYRLVYD